MGKKFSLTITATLTEEVCKRNAQSKQNNFCKDNNEDENEPIDNFEGKIKN
jgi:hypothetical protein